MAKNRNDSHILTIQSDTEVSETIVKETAIETLLNLRDNLEELIVKIEGDLKSLGYYNE